MATFGACINASLGAGIEILMKIIGSDATFGAFFIASLGANIDSVTNISSDATFGAYIEASSGADLTSFTARIRLIIIIVNQIFQAY